MRRLLYLLALSANPMLIFSQGFGGGPVLGANFCQIDGDAYGGYNKIGLQAGGYVYYMLNDRLAIQPEVLYMRKGSRESNETTFFHYRFSYLQVPILLAYKSFSTPYGSFWFQAGPSFDYLLGARKYDGISAVDVDLTSSFRKVGMDVHGGFLFAIKDRLQAGLRYSINVTNTLPGRTLWWRHRYFTLTFRYDFGRH